MAHFSERLDQQTESTFALTLSIRSHGQPTIYFRT